MRTLSCLLSVLALVACDDGGQKPPTKQPPAGGGTTKAATKAPSSGTKTAVSAGSASAAPGKDDPVDPAKVGDFKGSVKLSGDVPAPRKVLITKDEETCGSGSREIAEIEAVDGLLKNVVIYVSGDMGDAKPKKMPDSYKLLQKGCRFVPYIMWVPKGETLTILNDDPVAHNIHTYEMIGRSRRDLFNFSQPKKGHVKEVKIKPRRGQAVQLNCDIHDFMFGWIFVPDNPFAVIAENGKFTLEGVPAGKRTIKAYHPTLGTKTKQIDIPVDGEVAVEFEFNSDDKG